VEVYPNSPVVGYTDAEVLNVVHAEGKGVGEFNLRVVNTEMVPEDHNIQCYFSSDEEQHQG